ncbi:MAG: T9SS type A sorting domain-containing protein [Flavobacteriales bacterium]|nr:T9SS type A sorting domain-containing protein [Flavobacteriales bacterium]
MKTIYIILALLAFSLISNSQCIDPELINPDAICQAVIDPVCGCNDITYNNSCEAQASGVTAWQPGVCGETVDCEDLGGLDFGPCLAFLGVALVDGSCQFVSGCGYVSGQVDYSPFFFDNIEDCQETCGGESQSCEPVDGVDFGECDFVLGIGILNGQCQSISGCDYIVNGVDYSPSFFENEDDCQACLENNDCEDLGGIDFGLCQLALGVALVDGSCQSLSGCGYIVNGVDYSPYFYESFDECEMACSSDPECSPLDGIDFGDCEAVLGVGVLNGQCQTISGCGYIVDGVDYSSYFFENEEDCEACIDQCIDEDLIDGTICNQGYAPVCGCDSITYWNACVAQHQYGIISYTEGACDCQNPNAPDDIACFDLWDPVCGCDNMTYSNECYAFYFGHVTSWVPGECPNSVEEVSTLEGNIFPIPVQTVLMIEMSVVDQYQIELYDAQSRLVSKSQFTGDRGEISMVDYGQGVYHVIITNTSGAQFHQRILK